MPAGDGIKDPKAEAFAAHMTAHYAEFAAENSVYGELLQVAAAVSVAR